MASNRTSPVVTPKIIYLPFFGKLIACNDNSPCDLPPAAVMVMRAA